MLIHFEKKSILGTDTTWSSGDISKNTDNRLHGVIKQIFVKSDTSDTTFKFKLTNPDGLVVYDDGDYSEGTLNETDVNLPVKGIYTMTIYSSSLEEDFEIMLGMKEDY